MSTDVSATGPAPGGSARTVLLVNGPNLNLLGQREPHVYGTETLEDHVAAATAAAAARGVAVEHMQSNHAGVIVDAIHGARGRCAGIVLNGGAFTHYAWAITDALSSFDGPIVEIHISNPYAREQWRHVSVISSVATATIAGFGGRGYVMAVEALADLLER